MRQTERSRRVAKMCGVLVWGIVMVAWVGMAERRNPRNFEFVGDEGWGSWNGVLTGRIIDKEGRPIAGARVRVHSKDMETRTDRNGFFTFRGLQQGGRYSLLVDARGYDEALLRWIPIPRTHSADIGDWYLEELTNYWVVTSNMVAEGVWSVTSNMVEIAGSYTGELTYAEWVVSNLVWESAGVGGELPMIEEQLQEGGVGVETNAPVREEGAKQEEE